MGSVANRPEPPCMKLPHPPRSLAYIDVGQAACIDVGQRLLSISKGVSPFSFLQLYIFLAATGTGQRGAEQLGSPQAPMADPALFGAAMCTAAMQSVQNPEGFFPFCPTQLKRLEIK